MPNELSKSEQFEPVKLGGGQVLVSHGNDGAITAIKANITLSVENKEVVVIQNNPVITASGYDKINRIASVNLIMPPRIEVPNHGEQPNPFFVIDNETGAIRFVMAKMSGVGYSPVGTLCVVDQTLLFDLQSYLKMDCLAKIRKDRSAGRITGLNMLSEEEREYGYFLPILDKNYGVWLNTRHEEFAKVVSEHQQRQRFAERIALGILKRNCLKHHPAIGVTNVRMQSGVAVVPVLAWHKELPVESARQLVANPASRTSDIETIEKVAHTDDIAEADMAMATVEAGEAEMQSGASRNSQMPDTRTVMDPPEISGRDRILARIDEMKRMMKPSEWTEFWHKLVTSGRELEDFADEELGRFASVLERKLNLQKGS